MRVPASIKRFILIFFTTIFVYYLGNYVYTKHEAPSNRIPAYLDEEDGPIYFLETSGRSSLNYRQSCAVESAARQNPNRPVVIYIASETVDESSRSIQLLREYKNIRVERMDLNDYFNNTPLEDWYRNGNWMTSPYQVAHMSDYLRILSVYRHGGQYLDLDFVVIKSLDGMHNYVVEEQHNVLCNSVFHFGKGHPLVQKMIERLASNYQPNVWAAHGPLMVTSIMQSNCNLTDGVAWGPNCGNGVKIIAPRVFFPFGYDFMKLFQNNTSSEIPEEINHSYAVHMWNAMSYGQPVVVGSSQYYAILAAKYCPLSSSAALYTFK